MADSKRANKKTKSEQRIDNAVKRAEGLLNNKVVPVDGVRDLRKAQTTDSNN